MSVWVMLIFLSELLILVSLVKNSLLIGLII